MSSRPAEAGVLTDSYMIWPDVVTVNFITEEAAAVSQDTIDSYRDQMLPAVIPLPGRNGSLGIGMESIHMNMERAAGADIFKKT